ncbi:hypothetical protein Tco_1091938 [Tanacetum coccineum]|uniref:Retrovirus-related Pol polyprotein from transposon TNT 1-94-like beta-barrel domain-containing protein n=1 Tax=Tanacetum coccineum TaxID=301880 RepID=A0ABQ5I9S4_9ASTR
MRKGWGEGRGEGRGRGKEEEGGVEKRGREVGDRRGVGREEDRRGGEVNRKWVAGQHVDRTRGGVSVVFTVGVCAALSPESGRGVSVFFLGLSLTLSRLLCGIDELAIRNKVVNQEKTNTSQSAIDRNKVIIEDWVDSDDEETDVSESQKETVFNTENSEESFENRSPNSQNSVGQESRTKGLGNKGGKLCFVCYSPNHLIKDCNLHERTFKHTQTHKPKGTQGSRETRPVWNNIQRVNHSNFSRNSRYPHQRRSFIPSAVLTRDGLISTARPKMTQTVPSKSTANVTYQGTARSRVPQAVLSRSTDGSYYPRMDNRRPRISSYSPSSRSSTTRTPHRDHKDPRKLLNLYGLRREGNPEEDLKDYAIIDSGCSGSMTGDKDKLSDFKEFKGGYVAFGNDSKGGRISGKGTIKTSCLDFEKVSYVEELKFNLLSVSQICDKSTGLVRIGF